MSETLPHTETPVARPWRPQFGQRGLILASMAIIGAGLYLNWGWVTAIGAAPLPAPRHNGCRSSMADFPGMVQKTGTPVNSASAVSSPLARDVSTPCPAHNRGFDADSNALTASLISPLAGCCLSTAGSRPTRSRSCCATEGLNRFKAGAILAVSNG